MPQKSRSSTNKVNASPSLNESEREGYKGYPEESPIYISHGLFPSSKGLYSKLDYPLGIVTRPFIANHSRMNGYTVSHNAKDIERCDECGAYVNPYCDINNIRWFCCICGKRNPLFKSQTRYRRIEPKLIPELNEVFLDFDIPIRENSNEIKYSLPAREKPLIHIFLIQESMELDALQATIDALSEATASMHRDIYVVLMTFSNRVGIYSLSNNCKVSSVQFTYLVNSDKLESILETDEEIQRKHQEGARLRSLTPLSLIADFRSSISSINNCSQVLSEAIESVVDVAQDQETVSKDNKVGTLRIALDSICEWVEDSIAREEAEKAAKKSRKKSNDARENMITKLFSLLSVSVNGEEDDNAFSKSVEGSYLGVFVHAFIDHEQNPSFGQGASSISNEEDSEKALVSRLLSLNISLNLWAICSFESNETKLSQWQHIVRQSGGRIRRFSLGIYPGREIIRIKEELRRVLLCRYATRCLAKLRCTPIMRVAEDSVSGPIVNDAKDTHLYRANVMNQDTSFGLRLEYTPAGQVNWSSLDNRVSAGSGGDLSVATVVMQWCFSYEMLVESDLFEDNSKTRLEIEDDAQVEEYIMGSIESFGLDADTVVPSTDSSKPAESISSLLAAHLKKEKNQRNSFIRQQTAYDPGRKLVAKKFLRVFTLPVECIDALTRIKQTCNIPLSLSLTMREALQSSSGRNRKALEDKQQRSEALTLEPSEKLLRCCEVSCFGAQALIDAAIQIIVKNMEHMKKDPALADSPVDSLFSETTSLNYVSEGLQILFRMFVKTASVTSGNAGDALIDWIDSFLYLNPLACYSMLSPSLYAMPCPVLMRWDSIALKRESMLGSGCDMFLLDSGKELILYKSIQQGLLYSQPPGTNKSSSSSDAMDTLDYKISLPKALFYRLLEHPIVPSLIVSEAGTPSAGWFYEHLIEGNSVVSYKEFEDFALKLIMNIQ